MSLKVWKPVTPGRRQMLTVDFKEITKDTPLKSLVKGKKNAGGRNNTGKITTRHRGGWYRKITRKVDFKMLDKLNIPARVETIEYDPNRTAFLALVCYCDGERRYLLAHSEMKVGDEVITSPRTKIKPGNRLQLQYIPIGFPVYNLEVVAGQGGKLVRSAGANAKIVGGEGKYVQIQMSSGEIKAFTKESYATVGIVSNVDHSNEKSGKAGRTRWQGVRPTVRGKAMNPVDHPHGGGEGNSSIGMKYPKTPWGKHALGVKTRKKEKYSDKFIIKNKHQTRRK